MTIQPDTISHMDGSCGISYAHSDDDHVGGRPPGCLCRYERIETQDLCRQHGRGSVDEFGEPGPIPAHREFQAARLLVTKTSRCTGCGKTMPDEFTKYGFDGVMNNKLQPFHHGCEDF